MKIVTLPALYYETVIDKSNGMAKSRFFTSANPLKSRQEAIAFFLETWLADETANSPEVTLTVYLRHAYTNERLEILSCMTYQYGQSTLDPLQRELTLYKDLGFQVATAVWNHRSAPLVLIVPHQLLAQKGKQTDSYYIIADSWWLFLRDREEIHLTAS